MNRKACIQESVQGERAFLWEMHYRQLHIANITHLSSVMLHIMHFYCFWKSMIDQFNTI